MLVDAGFLPLLENVKDQLETVEAFIVMTDEDSLPEYDLEALYSY